MTSHEGNNSHNTKLEAAITQDANSILPQTPFSQSEDDEDVNLNKISEFIDRLLSMKHSERSDKTLSAIHRKIEKSIKLYQNDDDATPRPNQSSLFVDNNSNTSDVVGSSNKSKILMSANALNEYCDKMLSQKTITPDSIKKFKQLLEDAKSGNLPPAPPPKDAISPNMNDNSVIVSRLQQQVRDLTSMNENLMTDLTDQLSKFIEVQMEADEYKEQLTESQNNFNLLQGHEKQMEESLKQLMEDENESSKHGNYLKNENDNLKLKIDEKDLIILKNDERLKELENKFNTLEMINKEQNSQLAQVQQTNLQNQQRNQQLQQQNQQLQQQNQQLQQQNQQLAQVQQQPIYSPRSRSRPIKRIERINSMASTSTTNSIGTNVRSPSYSFFGMTNNSDSESEQISDKLANATSLTRSATSQSRKTVASSCSNHQRDSRVGINLRIVKPIKVRGGSNSRHGSLSSKQSIDSISETSNENEHSLNNNNTDLETIHPIIEKPLTTTENRTSILSEASSETTASSNTNSSTTSNSQTSITKSPNSLGWFK